LGFAGEILGTTTVTSWNFAEEQPQVPFDCVQDKISTPSATADYAQDDTAFVMRPSDLGQGRSDSQCVAPLAPFSLQALKTAIQQWVKLVLSRVL
jgi:hypothetical protein